MRDGHLRALPFFQRCRGYSLKDSHLVFTWFFRSFVGHGPLFSIRKFLSQFSHNFWKDRLLSTVPASFNTYQRSNRNISTKKTGFCIFLLKSLWTTIESHKTFNKTFHFNKTWSNSYAFQIKGRITYKCNEGGPLTTLLGHLYESLPQAQKL